MKNLFAFAMGLLVSVQAVGQANSIDGTVTAVGNTTTFINPNLTLRTATGVTTFNVRATILNSNGFMGIGTASPLDLLHVNGNARATQINLDNGVLNTTSGTTNMSFNINGTNRVTLLAGGNFGIGTAAPGAQLQVNPSAANVVGQIIKGATSQTGDLQQWQNSAGTSLWRMDALGNLRTGAANLYMYGHTGLSYINLYNGTTGQIDLKGSNSSGVRVWGALNVDNNILVGGSIGLAADQTLYSTGVGGAYLKMYEGANGNVILRAATNTASFSKIRLQTGTTPADRILIDENGLVGVGTSTPAQRLDVNGYMRVGVGDQFLVRAGSASLGYSEAFLQGQTMGVSLFANPSAGGYTTTSGVAINGSEAGIAANGSSASFVVSSPVDIKFRNNGAETIRVLANGNVGIGTTLANNTNGYKLAVNGKIGAKDVQVETSSTTWPDYVFAPGYNLPSLEQVEKFIQENKHLENVPSAAEIEKDGHKLGEMDRILLMKLEELTLYIIQQQKEIDELKKKLEKK